MLRLTGIESARAPERRNRGNSFTFASKCTTSGMYLVLNYLAMFKASKSSCTRVHARRRKCGDCTR
ncbi:hypothetical protein BofuT4_uP081630.1 [Botrytis cinerea T4]|uniref:Uncharacterized protein n=1 Tax=Botryotinia fuckeliana (strain T4) TaxID=999810 RepID=G2YK56_BOTF4|nr:hypothetical protein BofuT4_uP081630.1 [Botrytis cinerea T4]